MPTTEAASVEVFVPGLRMKSEMNTRGAWQKTYRRKREQMENAAFTLQAIVPQATRRHLRGAPALRVTLTRCYGGRAKAFDTDNLASSFKFVRDAVADWLDRDDSPTSGIEWVTEQERGAEYGVRIQIQEVQ